MIQLNLRTGSWSILSFVACASWVIGALSTTAAAQDARQQVLDLNQSAMTAYNNFEVDQARSDLQQALQIAEREGVTGTPLARTHLNLGLIAVAFDNDNATALDHFVAALRADSTARLDPLTATPDVQTVFQLAQQRVQSEGGGGSETGGGSNTGGGGSGGGGTLSHVPVPEQLSQTAVPVYIEVPGGPGQVYLHYRGHGMREFTRVEMQRLSDGFAFEIPCTDVFEPNVEYYIVAFAADGSPLGFAGTQNDPVQIQIVSTRTQPAPALPGRAPPETCSEVECPPGMSCEGRQPEGASCDEDDQCRPGLSCNDNVCSSGGGGSSNDMPQFFIHVMGGLGLGYAEAGMRADRRPDPADPNNPAFVPSGTGGCDVQTEGETDAYCVRVERAGLVPTAAVRLNVGWYPVPFLGFALFARFQLGAGVGPASFFLGGARVQVQFTEPTDVGFHAHAHVGFSVGQVQVEPPGNGDDAPWISSGLVGVPVGATVGYRIVRNFGIVGEVDFMFQFPAFLFNIDITAGVEFAF